MKRFIVLLLCLFCVPLMFVQNTFAVSDHVIYWTMANQGENFVICDDTDNNVINCSDYDYILFDTPEASTPGYSIFKFTYQSGTFINARFLKGLVTSVTLRDLISKVELTSTPLSSMTLTLTNDLDANPCPDPEENSQFIQVVLNAFWKYHAVFAGAVAALIAIFVVYRIIKGMLR